MAAPTVSVCLTTHDDAAWAEAALRTALEQTRPPDEIVVVDDGSTDGTFERLRALAGDGVVLVRNASALGEARATNRAFGLARGALVKPLHGDDLLAPGCLERLLAAAEDPAVSLVFSRRHVLVAPGDADGAAWAARYGEIHRRLGTLEEITPGRELFARYLDAGLLANGLSEPSGVLIRRTALERAGGLHLYMAGHLDVDLHMRLACFGDVGFVDAPLFSYRRHAGSATSRRVARRLHFLDRAWSLLGLRRYRGLWAAEPRLAALYRRELRSVARHAAGDVRLGPWRWKLARLLRLAAADAAARAGRGRRLHGAIAPAGGGV